MTSILLSARETRLGSKSKSKAEQYPGIPTERAKASAPPRVGATPNSDYPQWGMSPSEVRETKPERAVRKLGSRPRNSTHLLHVHTQGVEQERIDVRDLLHQLAHGHARAVSG